MCPTCAVPSLWLCRLTLHEWPHCSCSSKKRGFSDGNRNHVPEAEQPFNLRYLTKTEIRENMAKQNKTIKLSLIPNEELFLLKIEGKWEVIRD